MQSQDINITEDNNKLVIIINGEEHKFEIQPRQYPVKQFAGAIHDIFINFDINIHIGVYENGDVVMYSPQYYFSFKNEEGYVTRMFGFTEDYYEGKRVYNSENKHLAF